MEASKIACVYQIPNKRENLRNIRGKLWRYVEFRVFKVLKFYEDQKSERACLKLFFRIVFKNSH